MLDTENHVDSISELKLKYPPIVVEEAPEATLNYDVNGPRLMIVKIENENFKSYAGLKTLGPFHKNFTCIIGPNGSGKSNVIDALLFVFGFRASKIRSKKLSVLIHKSEMFPNINSCSVRVFFQMIKPFGAGDNDYDIIPNSEFIVTRSAFKDNSSVIKINDRKVTNKEVSEFLKKQGIDLDHNRFLILQGEVEQIAMMKPKAVTEYEDGLLEYLEDIIGSHRFKEPLTILFKRLEELCDLRTEKLNRVKVVAKEKKDLEGVRNEAVKYLRLCNEIVIRKNISFQIKLRELRLLEETAVEKQNEVKEELKKITDDIEKIYQLKLTKEKKLKEAVQNHLIKMQKFDISKKQFHELEIEDAELRDRRKHCKLNLDKLAKNIKLEEKELMKYEKVPEESVTRVEELLKEIKQLEENKSIEMENQEKIRAVFEHETKGLQLDKDKKTEELRNYQDLLVKQEAELSSQKCSLNCLVGSYATQEKRYLDLEEKVKSITVEITENKQKLEQLNVNIPKLNEEHQRILMEIENLKKEEAAIKAEVDVLFDKLQSGRSSQTEHKIIDFLFKQQMLGKVSGVYGRLGNLAAVDSKYDIAVSTACGRLDSIVTKEINNAQSCVELLKTCNIGSSTFIGLDKIQIWESRADRHFNSIAGAPRAFDLLTIPNKIFRCVFYFALKDLLITKDTKESVRINQQGKKYRMVTLKGETTEIHGAMTGGGNRLIKGKICTDVAQICETRQQTSNVQNADPQDLEQTHRTKEAQLNEITQRIKDLNHKLELVKTDMINAYQNKKIIQELLNNNLIKETELKKELETLKVKLTKDKPDAVLVKKLETSIEQISKKYKKDSEVVEKMTKEIDKINQEIELIGISKLQTVKSKIDAIVEEIKEKSGVLKKINLSVKNAEKICKRVTKTLEQFKEEKIKNEEDFKNMETTLKELEKKAEETLAVYQKVSEEVNELLKLKDEQSAALSQINEEIAKSKQIQVQISRDFDDKKLKVDQIRKSMKQKQDEISLLSCYVIPEDEDEAKPFMDLIGESESDMNIFSSQKDSHIGTKLKIYSDEELVALRVHQITYQDMEDKLAKQKPNLGAIEEYRMKEELYMQRAAELNEVTQLRDYQREQLEKLKRQRHFEFSAGFNLITGKLKEMYQMITMGGDAELELVDSLDPFSEGILFSVRPPKKSWKNIGNLSGGEKTLSSLALVFALHHFKPTPFYVMDEIDAALDFKNVSIVATYLKERTKNAQFIIISLRNNMYELSDRLVGIYKPYNVSKTCLINPNSLSWCLSSMRDISKIKNSPTETQPIEECTAANKNVDEATISEITS